MSPSRADRRIRPFKEGAGGQLFVWQEGDCIILTSERPMMTSTEMAIVLTQRSLTIGNLARKHICPDRLRYPNSEPRIALDQAIADAIGILQDRIDIACRELAKNLSSHASPNKSVKLK